MMRRIGWLASVLCLLVAPVRGQETASPSPRVLTLAEAVKMALEHNHAVRIAGHEVEQHQQAKAVARSAYFPVVKNETLLAHVTDTQFVEIPAGGLGAVAGSAIPPRPLVLNQGGRTLTSGGTTVAQPITELFKIRAANDVAEAALQASRHKARGVENQVALAVHKLYYGILIAEVRRNAVQARIDASEDLQTERVQQVKYGSALEADLIESKAHVLQARQELLTTELQLSDLHMQLNDVLGLPLTTAVTLDPATAAAAFRESCALEDCITIAKASQPEIAEARATVDKAASAVRLADLEYVPNLDVFARYDYSNNVPFLAKNFGTFGVRLTYDLFDGGKRRATIRERHAQLAQAKENLARVTDETELRVRTAFDKLERTRKMIAVSEELLALRAESRRVTAEQLTRGASLGSQAGASQAQELDATAALLQSRLDYVQALDEMDEAIGRTP
jgi:outer membrane protein TolC